MRPPFAPCLTVGIVLAAVGPAVALPAPTPVLHATAGPLANVRLVALPSGARLAMATSGDQVVYAVAPVGGAWHAQRRLPNLRSRYETVAVTQRGGRVLATWVGQATAPGSSVVVFADFRGVTRAPVVSRIFTSLGVHEPVAFPGATATGGSAVWSTSEPAGASLVADAATDPTGRWRTTGFVSGLYRYATVPSAYRARDAHRLIVGPAPLSSTPIMSSEGGPGDRLSTPQELYATPAGASSSQFTPVLRETSGVALLVMQGPDYRHMDLVAASAPGDSHGAKTIVTDRQFPLAEDPVAVSLPDGRVVAAWRQVVVPGRVQVWMAGETTVGGAWTTPVRVSDAGARAGRPRLLVVSPDRVVVAWSEHGHSVVRTVTAGARTVLGRQAVLPGAGRGCAQPDVGLLPSGGLATAVVCAGAARLYASTLSIP